MCKILRSEQTPLESLLLFYREGSHGARNPVFAPLRDQFLTGFAEKGILFIPLRMCTGQAAGLSNGAEILEELIVIGSGTGIPTLRRGSPGLLVFSDSTLLLIDSGSGTLGKMLGVGVTYRDPDLLLYTHIHPDHVSDLVPIIFASKYADQPRQKELLCIGGPGFQSYFEKLKNLYGSWIEPQSYPLTVKEIPRQGLVYRDLRIRSKPMSHISESVGYRIEFKDGKSMAVSGDTDYCQNIIDLAFEVDLLALECSFPDGKKVEGHLIPSLAGRIALESRCKKLLLTHLYPICDEFDIVSQCSRVYPGEIILGEDLMRIAI